MDYLAALNTQQFQAVSTTEGPLLILAGAGSGKTRVITYRIAYLIEEKGVEPQGILSVTFTNKAADEMKERVAGLLGQRARGLWIGTFHAICVRILRQDIARVGRRGDFIIYDAADQRALVKDCMEELGINQEMYEPKAVARGISSLKNTLREPDALQEDFGLDAKIARVYRLYQEKLKRLNALDFDDLLVETIRLCETVPDALSSYQESFRYIMVDEYQDTNHAQYRLIRLLSRGHRNICVVGDDDQGIYGFRGADVTNILEFEKDYPDAVVVTLSQNYRSTQTILTAASAIIQKNGRRRPKTLWTRNPQGMKVVLCQAPDEEKEAEEVFQAIERLRQRGGRDYGDVCILYRTHAQSRALEEAARRHGIPYLLVGSVRFYERKEIKDVLAYLRVLVAPDDTVSFQRIVNVPPRGIGEETTKKAEALAVEKGISLEEALSRCAGGLPPTQRKAVEAFLGVLCDLREKSRSASGGLRTSELVALLLEKTGYQEALKKRPLPEAEERMGNLQELISAVEAFEGDLPQFLDRVALFSDQDDLKEGTGAVTLMTLHCAKGLEFPVVFITGMEEGLFPHASALTNGKEMEEERRLCYVGMTRAREHLFLFSAERRRLYGSLRWNGPSRFLDEVPQDLVEENGVFSVGSSVIHPLWGKGVVMAAEGSGKGGRVTVSFPSVGTKKLAVKYARLTPAGGP